MAFLPRILAFWAAVSAVTSSSARPGTVGAVVRRGHHLTSGEASPRGCGRGCMAMDSDFDPGDGGTRHRSPCHSHFRERHVQPVWNGPKKTARAPTHVTLESCSTGLPFVHPASATPAAPDFGSRTVMASEMSQLKPVLSLAHDRVPGCELTRDKYDKCIAAGGCCDLRGCVLFGGCDAPVPATAAPSHSSSSPRPAVAFVAEERRYRPVGFLRHASRPAPPLPLTRSNATQPRNTETRAGHSVQLELPKPFTDNGDSDKFDYFIEKIHAPGGKQRLRLVRRPRQPSSSSDEGDARADNSTRANARPHAYSDVGRNAKAGHDSHRGADDHDILASEGGKPNMPASCLIALDQACGMKRGEGGACTMCIMSHASDLLHHGCPRDTSFMVVESYCAGADAPAVPAEPSPHRRPVSSTARPSSTSAPSASTSPSVTLGPRLTNVNGSMLATTTGIGAVQETGAPHAHGGHVARNGTGGRATGSRSGKVSGSSAANHARTDSSTKSMMATSRSTTPLPPRHAAQGLHFSDHDAAGGSVGGTVRIDPAHDESDVNAYVLYWGQNSKQKWKPHTLVLSNKTTAHDLGGRANTDPALIAELRLPVAGKRLVQRATQQLHQRLAHERKRLWSQAQARAAQEQAHKAGRPMTTTPFALPERLPASALKPEVIEYEMDAGTVPPPGATHLVLFSKNAAGEMKTGVSARLIDLVDPHFLQRRFDQPLADGMTSLRNTTTTSARVARNATAKRRTGHISAATAPSTAPYTHANTTRSTAAATMRQRARSGDARVTHSDKNSRASTTVTVAPPTASPRTEPRRRKAGLKGTFHKKGTSSTEKTNTTNLTSTSSSTATSTTTVQPVSRAHLRDKFTQAELETQWQLHWREWRQWRQQVLRGPSPNKTAPSQMPPTALAPMQAKVRQAAMAPPSPSPTTESGAATASKFRAALSVCAAMFVLFVLMAVRATLDGDNVPPVLAPGTPVPLELLALFSSPTRLADGTRVPALQLMREVASLQSALPANQQEVCAAVQWPRDVRRALRRAAPRVLQFSGHGDAVLRGPLAGALAFQHSDGTVHTPDPGGFIALLRPDVCPRLQALLLNGCKTHILAHKIVSALPHLQVVCCPTIVHTRASEAFARGFHDALGMHFANSTAGAQGVARGHPSGTTTEQCFLAGKAMLARSGFVEGDPETWVKPPQDGDAAGNHNLAPAATTATGPAVAANAANSTQRPHGRFILMKAVLVDAKKEASGGDNASVAKYRVVIVE